MKIRRYRPDDCKKIARLFFETVHAINKNDYTQSQLNAWANGTIDVHQWNKSFLKHNTVIVENNNIVIGFGDMDREGYLDRLYVHKDYQREGVATMILNKLEQYAINEGVLTFITYASITARPFFEKHGYCVVRENFVFCKGIELMNYVMKKQL